MRALLIAEKPDLMRKIQAVYDKHKNEIPYTIEFRAQRGHLVTLKLPDEIDPRMKDRGSWAFLPWYPDEHGGWQYKIIEEKRVGKNLTAKERYQSIKKELDSGKYDFVIHAGDPDQEGELLVNLVLDYAKNKLPVKRFWTNDLTESHILEALKNVRDDQNDKMLVNLCSAAKERQHWDYIYGMNMSRGASIQMHGRAAIGRVKTVLLNIIVQREKEIANFVPKTVYGVRADYTKGFTGTLFNAADAQKTNEYADADQKAGVTWFDNKADAENLINNKLSGKAEVIDVTSTHTKQYSLKLFKLSSAQVTAGKHGINDKTTLDTIQSLYEKGWMSYPRTDCEYMASDENFEGILKAIRTVPGFETYVDSIKPADIARVRKSKRWINDDELKKSGHSALSPTVNAPDWNSLSKTEQFIYSMIAKRVVAMFLPPLEQDVVEIVTRVNTAEAGSTEHFTFKSSGRRTTAPGYTTIFGVQIHDAELPDVRKGEILDVAQYDITEKTSTCPKRFTSPDLIQVCENPAKWLNDESLKKLGKRLKIGTPATRSGIISQLEVKDHYIVTKKEGKRAVLYPTESGTTLIDNLDNMMITRVDMTGIWEERLNDVRLGNLSASQMDNEMRADFEKMLNELKNNNHMKNVGLVSSKVQPTGFKCPVCGKPLNKVEWGWTCSGYNKDDENSCKFAIGYNSFGGKLKDSDIEDILQKGIMSKAKNFKSKQKGTTYKAKLKLNENHELVPAFDDAASSNNGDYYDCTWNGKQTHFKRTWSKHRFTDAECRELAAGNEVTINAKSKSGSTFQCSGHLEEQEYNGHPYLGFKMTENSASYPSANQSSKKSNSNGDYYECSWNGKPSRFKRTWGGHRFTDEQCKKLANGETIKIACKGRNGSYTVSGYLDTQEYNGHAYLGFKKA